MMATAHYKLAARRRICSRSSRSSAACVCTTALNLEFSTSSLSRGPGLCGFCSAAMCMPSGWSLNETFSVLPSRLSEVRTAMKHIVALDLERGARGVHMRHVYALDLQRPHCVDGGGSPLSVVI